jgi:hypothetical protein
MPPLEPGWSDEERELLQSAEHDAPKTDARQRTLAALGIGGAALSGAIATGSAKAAGFAAATPSAAVSGAATSGKALGLVKLLGVLTAIGVTGGAVMHYRETSPARAVATPGVGPNKAKKLAPVGAPVVEATPAPASANLQPPTESDAASFPAASASKPLPVPAAAHTEPDISLEIEALDRARRASEHGNFGAALSELDSYDRNFKQGRLRPEALLLRVQTLIHQGDSAGAKALGTRFLAKYPKSPLSPRIQKLIGSGK